MERNTSWGMLTTLNGNCPTLLFKDLYESKSNWNERDGSQKHPLQSLSTEHIVETVSAPQIVCFNVSYNTVVHCVVFFFKISMLS